MTEPVTVADFRKRLKELSEEEQRDIEAAVQEVRSKYHQLRWYYINMAHNAPEEGPNENSKGTPPNENSNKLPPPTKIEGGTPRAEN